MSTRSLIVTDFLATSLCLRCSLAAEIAPGALPLCVPR
jgi:hypothetical protein